jgi:NO-binding membrane sensor protein with MHYT domain/nitrogen-specific signal transduction histidine kinase
MLRVIGCITDQHDLRLIGLALVLCAFACHTALGLLRRATPATSARSCLWLAGAAVVFGCGVWATHFIAELAFQPGLPIAYGIGLTALSIAAAITLSGGGFALVRLFAKPGFGGAVIGMSVVSMHYIGMAALQVPAEIHWDARFVVASIIFGLGLGGVTLAFNARANSTLHRAVATGLLVLTICGMHFTGMAAVTLIPNPVAVMSSQVIDTTSMGVAVAAVAALIVGLALFGLIVDRKFAERLAREEFLNKHIAELQSTKAQLQATAANLEAALIEGVKASEAKLELERHLHHSQRLEALGTLAGGIAHDLNNALVPILSLSRLALESESGNSQICDDLRVIYQSGVHARDLVQRILAFGRKDAGAQKKAQIDEIASEALSMLRPSVPANVTIVSDIEKVPSIICDRTQIHQVLVNLVTNAAQAIGDRVGTISLKVLAVGVEEETSGRSVRVVVCDTGCGMSPDTMQRIFEPFFTTKAVGEGTGLGLSVVHGIVSAHKGTIDVQSALGVGTTVTLQFPAAIDLPRDNEVRRAA